MGDIIFLSNLVPRLPARGIKSSCLSKIEFTSNILDEYQLALLKKEPIAKYLLGELQNSSYPDCSYSVNYINDLIERKVIEKRYPDIKFYDKKNINDLTSKLMGESFIDEYYPPNPRYWRRKGKTRIKLEHAFYPNKPLGKEIRRLLNLYLF